MKRKKNKLLLIFSAIIIITGLFVIMFSGENAVIFNSILNGNLSKDEYKTLLKSFGLRGELVLGAFSALQVVFTFLPSEPAQVLSGVTYGFWGGFLICLIGVFIGNTVIFLLHKIFGDKIRDYFSKNIDIDFEDLRNSKTLTFIIFVLYFLPAIPYGLICFTAASFDMKYYKYITVTLLGSVPSILIGVGLGHLAISVSWIISLCVFIILVALLIVFYIKRKSIYKKINDMIAKKNSGVYTLKKHNAFFYFIYRIVFNAVIKFNFKYKAIRKIKKIEKPSIVLCNHGSFLDFLYMGVYFNRDKLNVIMNRMYFKNSLLNFLLTKASAIPKSMFSVDIECAKNSLRCKENGGILFIFPEARLSTVGEFEDIQSSTIRFIKKMELPVYTLKLNGNYFARPKWGDKIRRGALIEATCDKLFTIEQVKNLSDEEFSQKLNNAMYYNEYEWLKIHPELKYKSKTLAKGLDNILYKCPNCGKEFSLDVVGNTITCKECGYSVKLNDRYGFNEGKFENIKEWYRWQEREMEKEIKKGNFSLSDKVKLGHLSKSGKKLVDMVGEGKCELDKTGLKYVGTDGEKSVNEFFPMSIIYRLLFGAGEDFELYVGREIYYFVPEDKRTCVKWYIASKLLKDET